MTGCPQAVHERTARDIRPMTRPGASAHAVSLVWRLTRSDRVAYLMLTAMAICFGGTWVAGAVAVDAAPPFTIAAVRFGVASILLYAWARLANRPLSAGHSSRLAAHRRPRPDRDRRLQLALPDRPDAGPGVRRRHHRSGPGAGLHAHPGRHHPARAPRPARIRRLRGRGGRAVPGRRSGRHGRSAAAAGRPHVPGRRRVLGRVLGAGPHRQPPLRRRQRHPLRHRARHGDPHSGGAARGRRRAASSTRRPRRSAGIAYLALFGTVGAFVLLNLGVARIGAARASAFALLVPIVGVLSSVALLASVSAPPRSSVGSSSLPACGWSSRPDTPRHARSSRGPPRDRLPDRSASNEAVLGATRR